MTEECLVRLAFFALGAITAVSTSTGRMLNAYGAIFVAEFVSV